MQELPSYKLDDPTLTLWQTAWRSILNPFIKNPIGNGVFVKNVALINGATLINHTLGRLPQGWIIVDSNAGALVYRSQPFDPLRLTLTSSAPLTVTLYVF